MVTLFSRPTQKWTIQAQKLLEEHGWEYEVKIAQSCNGRDYNEQGIKTVPSLKIEMTDNAFMLFEGINAIRCAFITYTFQMAK